MDLLAKVGLVAIASGGVGLIFWHKATSLIDDIIDMTLSNKLEKDGGD